jgi:hypothetical protein
VDVASNLLFEDGDRLVVNSSGKSDTRAYVRGGGPMIEDNRSLGWNGRGAPRQIGFVLYARDDMLLSPGESLSANKRNTLSTQVLDIRYLGASFENATRVVIEPTKQGMELSLDTFAGKRTVPLMEVDSAGGIVFGSTEHALRVEPCAGVTYCIGTDDHFIIGTYGKTFILRYSNVDAAAKELILRDTIGRRYDFPFTGEPGDGAHAVVVLDGARFTARIGPLDNVTGEYNISIDGLTRDIHTQSAIVKIGKTGEPVSGRLTVTIDAPEEDVMLTVQRHGTNWIVNSSETFYDDEDDLFAVTPKGIAILLDTKGQDLPRGAGREADILIPTRELYGIVHVE